MREAFCCIGGSCRCSRLGTLGVAGGLWSLRSGEGTCCYLHALVCPHACRHGYWHCCMLSPAVLASLTSCIASMAVGGHPSAHRLSTASRSSTIAASPPLQPASPEVELLLAYYNKSCIVSDSSRAGLGAAHHCRRTPVRSTSLDDGRPSAGYSQCVAHCQPSLWHYFHAPDAPWSGPVPSRV